MYKIVIGISLTSTFWIKILHREAGKLLLLTSYMNNKILKSISCMSGKILNSLKVCLIMCIDRIRALLGSFWYKDVRFYKKYNFFCKRVSLSASIHLWVCDDKAIFSWDMDDDVSSNVRRIGVQIEQKRVCTLCSKRSRHTQWP